MKNITEEGLEVLGLLENNTLTNNRLMIENKLKQYLL